MVCKYFNRFSYERNDKTLQFREECWGTKEREVCSCGGDTTKCTFYPEIRLEALAKKNRELKIKKLKLFLEHPDVYPIEDYRDEILLIIGEIVCDLFEEGEKL